MMSETIRRDIDNNERIGRLETSVEGLQKQFDSFGKSLANIEHSISRGKETNWSVIFAGIAIVGSLWLAAIRPITQDIERGNGAAKDIATAVLVKEEKITQQRIDFEKLSKDVSQLRELLTDTRLAGSPITDKRLTLIEFRLNEMGKVKTP
jgi:archaellum component FlaC